MNFEDENIEQFDRFIQNEMNPEELKSFESQCAIDAKFKQEFQEFEKFDKALKNSEVRAFKDQLKDWDKEETPESLQEQKKETPKKEKGRIIPIRFLTIAASVALVAFLAVNYFNDRASNQELVASYYTPYDNVVTVRGAKEDIDEGFGFYEAGDYPKAIELFAAYPDNSIAMFYLGESNLANKNYSAAIATYTSNMGEFGVFEDIAKFHLSLAYLGAEKTNLATDLLHSITTESDYFEQAQALLADLE